MKHVQKYVITMAHVQSHGISMVHVQKIGMTMIHVQKYDTLRYIYTELLLNLYNDTMIMVFQVCQRNTCLIHPS